MKYIISGGGTGGHIFPAISIANAISEKDKEAEILFVGAEDRMEMQRVPKAGYPIKGLPVKGFDRKNIFKNIKVVVDLIRSIRLANRIIKEFQPDVAIGVGGYASAPTLKAATKKKIPTLLQEQNSYAGVTNKLLAKDATKICVAYDNMERYFQKEKIVLTGNPVRKDLLELSSKNSEAYEYFGLDQSKKTLLVVGGSLGARTINQSIEAGVNDLLKNDIQVIWQTGKYYFQKAKELSEKIKDNRLYVTEFISRMDYAYSVADLVVSRAGAGSISELCLLKKPVVLIPSPNVAEDHQTKNAMALVEKKAAIMVRDIEAKENLVIKTVSLINDNKQLKSLSENIQKLAQYNSDERIVEEVFKIIKKKG